MPTSAPSSRQTSSLAAVPAVVNTRAPARAASWMAIVPMPLEPPCTRKASPAPQPGQQEDVRPDGAGDLGQRRGGGQLDAGGPGQQLPRRDGDPLGVAAAGEQRAHLVADRPAGHALADLADDAAALQAEDVAGALRRRVEALPLQEVGAVHRRRRDVDDHLARAAHRVGHLAPAEHLGTAGLATVTARMARP